MCSETSRFEWESKSRAHFLPILSMLLCEGTSC